MVGRGTYGMPRVVEWPEGYNGSLLIGNYCSIAGEVTVLLGGEHLPQRITTYPFSVWPDRWPGGAGIDGRAQTKGDVVIGSDVWIGLGATILSGVTIGHGAVVGARSVVAGAVPPYAVVIGNPARVLRYRFAAEMVARLLALAWWEWPEERINALLPQLLAEDPPAFLAAAEEVG